ncbi:MAG TPA: chitobiase/beta-hexosaminidase C-terminal domain-containing protein, partial [Spirochaetota bacterium]|nr:chitobiase/beta-hexosaminidase C-terminal domain-containing protein [Spirochaetota bacterium]
MILKKIKEYSKTFTFAIIIVALVVSFGCSNHSSLKYDNEDQDFAYEKGYGLLEVNIPTVRGWTVAQYDVVATKSGETSVTASTASTSVSLRLKIGTWTISVVGKDSYANTIYQGVASANVTESGNSVTIGLLKKAGNYKLTLNSTYPVVSGQPGYIEKIVVTASRGQGFADVVAESNAFSNSFIFSGLAQGNWTFTARGYAAGLDSDYQPTGTEVLFLEDSYTLNVVASKITSSTQNLNTQKKATPVKFSHLAGTYSGTINVSLSCDTAGATIYYTTDGSNPTTSGTKKTYSTSVAISATTTLKVAAVKSGLTSSIVGSRLYTIDAGVTSTPQMNPTGGTYNSDQNVVLSCADAGAIIYYTTDGSTPTTSSTQYLAPIAVSGNGTTKVIRAIAKAGAKSVSGAASQSYTISYLASSAPTFTPASGNLTTNDNITIECGTSGASIYYTTDGSDPKISGTRTPYTSPFSLAVGTYTVKAYSTASGYADSTVTSGEFNVTQPQQDNSIIFATAETIISGEEWNPSSLAAGINLFGVDIFDTGTFKLEWSETYSGSVTMYENDLTTPLSLTGTGPSRTVSLVSGERYFINFNSTYEMANFSVRIYLGASGGGGALGSNYPSSGSYSPVNMADWGTATWELGANYVSGPPSNLRIGVFAANATKVLLEIYSQKTGQTAQYDYWMAKGSDGVWRAELNSVPNYALYAFRAWGPNWSFDSNWTRGNSASGFTSDVDAAGNRYNPNKVLYDPYAKEISHDKETPEMAAAGENGGMYGTGGLTDLTPHDYKGPCTNNVNIDRRNVDTGKWAPKSVAVYNTTSFGTKPNIAEKDGIIYEAHVRGLTQHSSSISLPSILSGVGINTSSWGTWFTDAERGTYKAAGKMAKYLKALGYTTIELLPVHETANDINPADSPGGNYWGYMTYGYFAPDRRYSYDKTFGGPTKEFKEMCAAFHAEGLEVYLDVVYNHTGEGGNWDPSHIESPVGSGNWIENPDFTTKCKEITSFAGLDNANYYALVSTDKGRYWETTGCGNNMDV